MRPGACQEIELSVTVDDRAATQLNVGDARLEATLILHTALGKDGFITVCGEYGKLCSCAAALCGRVAACVPVIGECSKFVLCRTDLFRHKFTALDAVAWARPVLWRADPSP